MASTEVTLFQGAKLPAHIRGFEDTNITARGGVNQLSIMGKVWRTIVNGKETPLTKTDAEGDTVPAPIVRFVVLQHNQARSRSYFEGDFDPKKPMPPTCWSDDGVTPAEDVPESQKQARKCAKCPQAAKGSKITKNGAEATACAQFKRVAIRAAAACEPDASDEIKAQFPPMLLKLPQTSLWDKNADAQAAKGWYAWDQYLDFLRQNGVKHTGLVITKAKFDPEPAYPKVLFKAENLISEEMLEVVKPSFADEEITKLLSSPENVPTVAKAKEEADDDDDTPPQRPARAKKGGDDEDDTPPKKTAKKVVADDEDEPPKAVKRAAAAAKVADDDDEDDAPAPKKTSKHVVIDDEDDTPPPKKTKAVDPDDDEDEDAAAAKAAAKKGNEEAKARVPERKKVVADDDDDDAVPVKKTAKKVVDPDDEDDTPPPKKTAKKVVADDEEDPPAKKPAGKGKTDDLQNLLKDWPDDDE